MSDFPPVYAISAGSIVRYYEYPSRGSKLLKSQKSLDNLTRGKFNGEMSDNTRKDLRKKLTEYFDAMFSVGHRYRTEKKICHPIITLTLPAKQMHEDNEIKREGLMRFVELMRKKYDVKFYYWVAEKQKNENIHFHILIDRFVDWQWIRKAWNARLDILGYIDEFEKAHGHRDPNSTDIQLIKDLAKSSDYVTKYTSKVSQQGGIQGRLHGECDILRFVQKFKPYGSHEMDMKISEWFQRDGFRGFSHDHCVGLYGNIRKLLKEECPKHFKAWQLHHQEIANMFYD